MNYKILQDEVTYWDDLKYSLSSQLQQASNAPLDVARLS